MPHLDIAGLVVAVLATAPLVACSGQSSAAPSTARVVPSDVTTQGVGPGVEGEYILNLANTKGQVVSSLPVVGTGFPSELVLWAQVKDSSGVLATDGAVIFQACRKGGADSTAWRPSADCVKGTAAWTHLSTVDVTEGCLPFAPDSGNACRNFGTRPIPQTIGFRYLFKNQGGAIANGESMPPQNMRWGAAP
jgi:hypothetical protein